MACREQDKENMFLNKKQIKILIIVFTVVVLTILAILFIKKQKQNIILPIPQQGQIEEEQKIVTPQIENKVVPKKITEESLIENVSRNFAERLGSYSTDNKAENFLSAYSYLTEEAKNSLKSYIDSNEKLKAQDYYGVSSKSLNSKVVVSGSSATAIVKVQQVETIGNDLKSSVVYKNLNLNLIKQGDLWLISSFKWE